MTQEEIRNAVFRGKASIKAWSDAKGQSERSTYNEIARGLPTVRIGRSQFIDVDKAPEFYASQSKPSAGSPRRPGRPRTRLHAARQNAA
jgi:hypothetical protein